MKNTYLVFGILLLVSIFNATAQSSFEVERTGNGQAILLFPGFANTPEVFDFIKNDLSENFEIHAFTFAGFGGVPPIEFP